MLLPPLLELRQQPQRLKDRHPPKQTSQDQVTTEVEAMVMEEEEEDKAIGDEINLQPA
jgi:hypothetical protein